MRRHKRLRDGFAERLVPQSWPGTPAMQAPALIRPDYGPLPGPSAGDIRPGRPDLNPHAPSPEPSRPGGQAASPAVSGASEAPGPALSCSAVVPDTPADLADPTDLADLTDPASSPGGKASSFQPSPHYCDLWIQAASGGEAYLAWEILRLLAACGGGLRVLCTTCTRQGLEVLHKAQQELALASIGITVNFLPLDEPPLMRRAVERVFGPLAAGSPARAGVAERSGQPERPVFARASGSAERQVANSDVSGNFRRGRVLVLLETEIWPGLLAACSQAGVRVLILNARMTEGSFKAYRLLAPLLRRYAPEGIFATSESDLRRFCLVFDGKYANFENNCAEGDLNGRSSTAARTGPVLVQEARPQVAASAPSGLSGASDQSNRSVAAPAARGEGVSGALPRRGLMRNIKFDRVFLGGEARRPDPARRPASGAAPYPPERELHACLAEHDRTDDGALAVGGGNSGCTRNGPGSARILESNANSPLPGPILLASTREEEEEGLLAVLAALRASGPEFPIIVAPRHLHRVAAWEKALSARAAGFGKRSDCPDAATALALRSGEIRIWDAFGEMDTLYSRAAAVFVGGSLAPLGGQNFLEPLAAGLEPVIGPSWSNFYWAGNELFDMKLVRMVQSADELAPVLLELARSPRPRPEVISRFNAYLAPRRGGTRQAVELILERILLGESPR